MEGVISSLSADALIYPKKYTFADREYSCYIRIIPGYFDKGSELTSLKNDGDKRLQELLERYDTSQFNDCNGIEYATAMINTVHNGLVISDFTVTDGDLVTFTYSFTSEYFKEAMALRNYLLKSIFRTGSEQ